MLPYSTYGIIVWDQAAKFYIERILKKRALRFIYSAAHYLSYASPYFHLDILQKNLLYILQIRLRLHGAGSARSRYQIEYFQDECGS